MRKLLVFLLAGCMGLGLTGAASAITITPTTVDGYAKVTWSQPDGYPDAYVDYVEVGTAAEIDADGFFPIENLVDYTFFLAPAESTGVWQSDLKRLSEGVTYYAHVEVYRQSDNTSSWSAVVSFTVGGSAVMAPGTGAQPPVATQPPAGEPAPPGTEPPTGSTGTSPTEDGVQPAGYEVRLRRTASALLLAFREPAQQESDSRRYKICWTEGTRGRCQKRTIAAGGWDELRLPLRPSLGRLNHGRRVVDITWLVGAVRVAARRVPLG